MKKLIKNEICGSVNSARMYYSRKTDQKLRLLFMYRTWTVATSGEKTREKKKKKKGKTQKLKRSKRQPKHTRRRWGVLVCKRDKISILHKSKTC